MCCDYLIGSRAEVFANELRAVGIFELYALDTFFNVNIANIVGNTIPNSFVKIFNNDRTEVHERTVTAACAYLICRTAPKGFLIELDFFVVDAT